MGKFSLLTTLTLNAGGYDKGINKAKQKTQDLKKTTMKVSDGIKKAFAFAGVGLGVAGLIKGVKATINSVQGAGDTFHNTMVAAQSATSAFFQAIATGDWGNMISNMRDAAKAGKEYAEALDDIGDRSRSVSIHSKKALLEIKKLEAGLTDLTLSDEERKKIIEEVNRLTLDQFKKEEKLAQQKLNAEKANLKKKHDMSDEAVALLFDYFENYQNLTKAEHDQLQAAFQAQEHLEKLRMGKADGRYAKRKGLVDKELEGLSEKQLAYFNIGDVINKVTDEERDQIGTVINSWTEMQIVLQKFFNKASKAAQTLTSDNVKLSSSFSQLIITAKKLPLIMSQIADTNFSHTKGFTLLTPEEEAAMTAHMDKIRIFNNEMTSLIQNGMQNAIMSFADGIGALLVTGNIEDFGKGILDTISSFLVSFGDAMIWFGIQTIALAGFIKVIKDFMFKNPITAIIGGIALIAAAGAMKAASSKATEKYADGGIVGGSLFSGDRVHAMVNSGEMILNTGQQRNLFDMIKGGGSQGQVEFVLRGENLYGSIENYSRKSNNYR